MIEKWKEGFYLQSSAKFECSLPSIARITFLCSNAVDAIILEKKEIKTYKWWK